MSVVRNPSWPTASLLAALLVLAGCATRLPSGDAPADVAPGAWQAPLPHGGEVADLSRWWQQFDDPQVAALVDASQRSSPNLAAAAARIAQARAQLRAAGAGRQPQIDAKGSVTRSRSEVPPPAIVASSAGASIDAAWELDLFGGTRSSIAAAQARAQGAEASWHDARVSLAAEVANTYVSLRACEAQVAIVEQDAAATKQIADLTQRKVQAGFESPANGSLANANFADAAQRLQAQRTECEVLVKALVALTAQPEADVRAQLAGRAAQLPQPRALAVNAVPAQTLAQRPDLVAAARNIAAATAQIGVTEADRYPRVTLLGSIGLNTLRTGGTTFDGPSWSFGPSISLPLLDFGRRAANVEAARAARDEAIAVYRQSALGAVREVEESLLRLDSAARREADARRSAEEFRRVFDAAQARWTAGTASQIELQDVRRQLLGANGSLLGVQRERVAAWINLYKALGGGWDGTLAPTAATASGSE